jgi:pimeloyl-ACP methyl ester carboxylesterase
VRLTLWPELFWATEWASLRVSPVYSGAAVPSGRGEPVVVVPGFLASDRHTTELRRWLTRIGYSVHPSGIGRNDDSPDVALEKLEETIIELASLVGGPVRLVGHSLGGTLARAAAVRRPDLVSQVITLGSPLKSMRTHPIVAWVARLLGEIRPLPAVSARRHGDHTHDASCACQLLEALEGPFPAGVDRTSIFSKRDGIVDWRSCVDEPTARNVVVNASHLGMLVNEQVYLEVSRALATSGHGNTQETAATVKAA